MNPSTSKTVGRACTPGQRFHMLVEHARPEQRFHKLVNKGTNELADVICRLLHTQHSFPVNQASGGKKLSTATFLFLKSPLFIES